MLTTGGNGRRPVDRYMMYIDIDFVYHSQLSTTFNQTVNKPIILTHAWIRDQFCIECPIHVITRVLLKFHASHGKVQLEFAIE